MALSERYAWFKSITAIKRKSHGSWLFSVSVLICFAAITRWDITFFYLPILILTVADPLAGILGKRLNYKPLTIWGQTKTIGGSIAFFVAAILVSFGFSEIIIYLNLEYRFVFPKIPYSAILLIALVATLAELLSTKGWDNLTIPLSVIAMLLLYL
jgi:dolichol kinase